MLLFLLFLLSIISINALQTHIIPPPRHLNRFNIPWHNPPHKTPLPLHKSANRLLHSPIRSRTSDGIGHSLTLLNTEISTALQFRLTYTHRISRPDTLADQNPLLIENLFPIARFQIPRSFVHAHACHARLMPPTTTSNPTGKKCPICLHVRPMSGFRSIVHIPRRLLYGCITCARRVEQVDAFLNAFPGPDLIFQMDSAQCATMPKSPDFGLSYGFFFWKYWDLHGDPVVSTSDDSEDADDMDSIDNRFSKRHPVQLDESELSIAVHARRGDFFFETKRRMVSCRAFAETISAFMDVVRETGGVFSNMPVAIYIYAEGRRLSGAVHQQAGMDDVFVDDDGSPRDAQWFLALLLRGGGEGGDVGFENVTRAASGPVWPFVNGVRVEFRIGKEIVRCVHEMASADLFIGSESDLSQYAVRVISRGVQLLPVYMGSVPGCCAVRFQAASGRVLQMKRLRRFWAMFADANAQSASRAVEQSRRAARNL